MDASDPGSGAGSLGVEAEALAASRGLCASANAPGGVAILGVDGAGLTPALQRRDPLTHDQGYPGLARRADLPGRRTAMLVDTPARFDALLDALARARPRALGLDTEAANIDRGGLYRESPSLLQLAFRDLGGDVRVAVIDLLAIRDVRPLQPVLARPETVVFAHNYAYDERMLLRLGLRPRCVYDTCRAGRVLYEGAGRLADLSERLLETAMDKALQESDWGRRPLSREQIAYAARDAADTLVIGELARRVLPDVPETKPALPPAARAAYRHLLEWRAATAAAMRRFPEDILPQRTMRAIASRHPTAPAELQCIPGMGDTRLARYSTGILTALATAELEALLAGTPLPRLEIAAATLADDGIMVRLATTDAAPVAFPTAAPPCLERALRQPQPWRLVRAALAGLRLHVAIEAPPAVWEGERAGQLLSLFAAPAR
jgi:ribonuclease D